MKHDKIPHSEQIVNEMRKMFYKERYKGDIRGKGAAFDKNGNQHLTTLEKNN